MNELHAPTLASDGVLRPTRVTVNLDRLIGNYRAIQRETQTPVMAILKANAYGHGLVEVACALEAAGVDALGVAYLEEGLHLRRAGVDSDILVLGGIIGSQIPLFIENDLILAASSVDKLTAIDQAAAAMQRVARVHLKIDTGMERIGVHWYSADILLEASLRCEHIAVEGVFSHLANADELDLTHARLQLERFSEVLRFYEARSLPMPVRHIANSGAIVQLPESHLDLVRPGILLYGVYPSGQIQQTIQVKPTLSWTSRVVYFKVVRADHPVSYGSTWAPDQMTRVVTLPVGYGDGYLRAMSGQAEVGIGGRRYPVVGRICMDQVMVDIGWDSAWNGDEVVLLGVDGDVDIRCEDLAAWAGTIPYEILTSINTRVPRVYLSKG